MIKRLVVVVVAAGLVLATAGGAMAAQLNLKDPAKDNMERGLDIVSASIGNRDRAVVATVSFRRERLGDVVVFVRTRHHGAVGLAVAHHRNSDDVLFLSRDDKAKCPRLEVDWMANKAMVRFRMPSRCLNDGNYGAIKTEVLTEGAHGGGDTDYAPVDEDGYLTFSDWFSRG